MHNQPPKVIAEVGCNHKGDMEIAHELILTAAIFCKTDVVKFQKRCNKELLTPEQYVAPHPNPMHAYGETYGAHREFLELDLAAANLFSGFGYTTVGLVHLSDSYGQ